MKQTRTNNSNNRIVIFLMILGLTAMFLSGCGQLIEPAKNAANTTPNTTTISPDSAPAEGYTGETKKQELKNISLPFAEGEDLSVEVANDGTVIYEKDMILGNISDFTKNSSPVSAQLSSDSSAKTNTKPGIWANSTIPYVLPDNHGKKDVILAGIKEINEKTNICLVPRTTETDYVEFISKNGHWSKLGRVGGQQEISIDQTVSNVPMGTVAHEIMHAAGFVHMQSREDRDETVTINTDNIVTGMESQFRKLKSKSSNIGAYDFTSIMHYSAKGFSKNGKNTIDVKAGGDASKMGQRKAMSAGDIAAIAVKYSPGPCKSGAAKPPEVEAFGNNLVGTWVNGDEKRVFTRDHLVSYLKGKLTSYLPYRILDKETVEVLGSAFSKDRIKITFADNNSTLDWRWADGNGFNAKRESNNADVIVGDSLPDKIIGHWVGISGTNSDKEKIAIADNQGYKWILLGSAVASFTVEDKTLVFQDGSKRTVSVDGNVMTVEDNGVTKKYNRQMTVD